MTTPSLFVIRDERREDIRSICDVHDRAFGQPLEGRLIEALRSNRAAVLSLVATLNDRVVGHVLYSPASVASIEGAALGPMAVSPEHQRQGIGGKLVDAGSRRLGSRGCPFIVVLGHASFYPRYGFRPASARGISCEWDVAADAFMLLVLDEVAMRGVSGVVKYRGEFSALM
jgi:putative acetyltransferase